jgi:thiopurine S-methyltransferase
MSTDRIETWECHWSKGDIPWQLPDVNQRLVSYMEELLGTAAYQNGAVVSHRTILVPLCGKSKDVLYLYEQGHTVAGCEWVEAGCLQFFSENNIPYTRVPLQGAEGSLFQVGV